MIQRYKWMATGYKKDQNGEVVYFTEHQTAIDQKDKEIESLSDKLCVVQELCRVGLESEKKQEAEIKRLRDALKEAIRELKILNVHLKLKSTEDIISSLDKALKGGK
jgi:hypothetical protein